MKKIHLKIWIMRNVHYLCTAKPFGLTIKSPKSAKVKKNDYETKNIAGADERAGA